MKITFGWLRHAQQIIYSAMLLNYSGDHCNFIESNSSNVEVSLVGCTSHRYNLALKDMYQFHNEAIWTILVIVKKVKYGINADKLKNITHLNAKHCTDICWGSTILMVKRYIDIKEDISGLKIHDIDAIMPNSRRSVKIRQFYNRLKQHKSVPKEQQKMIWRFKQYVLALVK